jgi:hypothetical protein
MLPTELNVSTQILGYQRFLFFSLPAGSTDDELVTVLERLAEGMENMQYSEGQPAEEWLKRGRYQYLRAERSLSQARDLAHPAVLEAQGLIRLEAASVEPFLHYQAGLKMQVEHRGGSLEVLPGVQRGRSYTSAAMYQFSNAPALLPSKGSKFQLGVVTPLNKTAEWWSMDWMHRETFFLPRYDSQETLIAKGHSLAAAAGIPCLIRRLVHAPDGYGKPGGYDFIGYFEFAEQDAEVFRSVMRALRDQRENPEWRYVREGPEWWGRRVASAKELLGGS